MRGERSYSAPHTEPSRSSLVAAPSQNSTAGPPERCILAALDLRSGASSRGTDESLTAEESLAELAELARSAGAEVIGQVLQTKERPSPATLLGTGKLLEIQAWAAEEGCDFVLFDHDLTASQHRNLERALERPVLDRTQLIMDIFAKHARSREGRLQVELAQLDYLLPRLAGRGAEMSRLGGGIGTRGPGETQLESDRRKIRRRIVKLRSDLERVRSTRRLQRAKRTSVPLPTIALCGYTNAGKSTLFNRLTRANVLADAKMFATLDPTLRKLRLPSKRLALLSDTVGFLRKLPPTLIQAFRATLEEVTEAALILHVVDLSSDHCEVHRNEVTQVLHELGASATPQLLVLNKRDLVQARGTSSGADAERIRDTGLRTVTVSAKTGQGLEALLSAIDDVLADGPVVRRRLRVPYDNGGVLSLVYDQAIVLERRDREDGVELVADLRPALAHRLSDYSDADAA